MLSIRDRLLLAEDECISAITAGDDALSAFLTSWDNLYTEIERGHACATLDVETLSLARVTAVRMSAITDVSAELFVSSDNITTRLVSELEGILSDLTINDPNAVSPLARVSDPYCSPDSDGATPHHGSTHTRRKRLRDTPVECEAQITTRSSKRRRMSLIHEPRRMPSRTEMRSSQLPPSVQSQSALLAAVASQPSRSSLRKRRLSETDTSAHPSKRMSVGPRLHAVSDSYCVARFVMPADEDAIFPQSCYEEHSEPAHHLDVLQEGNSEGEPNTFLGLPLHPLPPSISLPTPQTTLPLTPTKSVSDDHVPALAFDGCPTPGLSSIFSLSTIDPNPLSLDTDNSLDAEMSVYTLRGVHEEPAREIDEICDTALAASLNVDIGINWSSFFDTFPDSDWYRADSSPCPELSSDSSSEDEDGWPGQACEYSSPLAPSLFEGMHSAATLSNSKEVVPAVSQRRSSEGFLL